MIGTGIFFVDSRNMNLLLWKSAPEKVIPQKQKFSAKKLQLH